MHWIDPMKTERATAVLVDFCHTNLRFWEQNSFGTSLQKPKTTYVAKKKPISSYFGQNSEVQNYQDYRDPTVVP